MNSQNTFFNATILDAQKTITRLWHVRFTRTSSEGTSHGSSSETHREESNTQMHGSICTETENHLMQSPAETRMPSHKCAFQFIQCFAGPQNVVRVKIEPRFEICWKIHIQTITAPMTWNLSTKQCCFFTVPLPMMCPSFTSHCRIKAFWQSCESRVLKTKHAQLGFRNTLVLNSHPSQHPARTEECDFPVH